MQNVQSPKSIPPLRRRVHPHADTLRRHGELAVPALVDRDRLAAPAQQVRPLLARMALADEHAFRRRWAVAEDAC